MRKLTLIAAAVAMAASFTTEVNAGANDTAKINAVVPPSITIGGGSTGGGTAPSGSQSDAANDPGSNTNGGTLGGIAYGQTYGADRSPDGSAFWATGHWLIHSNVQVNKFACAGTDLYKGGVNPAVAGDFNTLPIPLDTAAPGTITASLSQDQSGGGGSAAYSGVLLQDGNWEFKQTNFVSFHAGTQEPTQWVSCKLHWTNTDPEKAQGDYMGFMRVYAMYGGNGA